MKKTARQLALLSLAGVLVLTSALAAAQSGSFILSQHGHSVGTASFDIVPSAQGYNSSSVVHLNLKGLDYAISKTERLSAAYHLRHSLLSAIVNGSAVNLTAAANSTQILLNISANGQSSTTRLNRHAAALLLPDLDPGALETLLALAAAQNNRNLWAIIPKQAGSIEPIQLATYSDEQGTLNGKPILVHHLVATIANLSTDLFSSPDNQLLQAEFPQQGFALVRNGFVLTPPAKPGPPPAEPSAPTQQPVAPSTQPATPPAE